MEKKNKEAILKRFGLLLLGARAHVIADTWAHQDWCAANNLINTYWDIKNSWYNNQFEQRIDYQDISKDSWETVKLAALKDENLQAVPNATSSFPNCG